VEKARRAEQDRDIDEYSRLGDLLGQRPADGVRVIDFLGDPIGEGLRDGKDSEGHTVVRVPSDMLDVAARAEGSEGPIPDVTFSPLVRDR
jgi:hypothetical protein